MNIHEAAFPFIGGLEPFFFFLSVGYGPTGKGLRTDLPILIVIPLSFDVLIVNSYNNNLNNFIILFTKKKEKKGNEVIEGTEPKRFPCSTISDLVE